MNATLHLPDGRRVRTVTGRRYVVVVAPKNPTLPGRVLGRSDAMGAILARRTKESKRFSPDTPLFVFDTTAPASPIYPKGF